MKRFHPAAALAAAGIALALAASGVQAQAPAAPAAAAPAVAAPATAAPAIVKVAAPAGFVAPAEPRPDETNAERAKSQPGNNAPVWRAVKESGTQPGYSSLPGLEQGVLIQPFVRYPGSQYTTAGEAWRQVRNNWIIPYGGALLLIIAGAIALFYWRKGALGHAGNDGAQTIERFTPFERSAHWANAIAFVALAVSGVVMAWGKYFLLPVLGPTLFGWLAYALKNLHNFAGPVFAVSLVVVFATFVRDNLPARGDWAWLKKGGGILSGHEVPSHRFNAAEKLLFWGGVFLLGAVVVASGLFINMLVPGVAYTRGNMQVALIIHGVSSALMMAMFIGHIYIGTVGMKGAYKAMRTGYVDAEWAREHHELWADDIARGKIAAQRSGGAPAAGVAAAQT